MAKPMAADAKKTQREDLTFFLEGRLTDVEFLVENGSDRPKVFKAHKTMLAIRNEVFEAMFYGKLPEQGQVRITDLHPDGFFIFLKYLYSRKATFENIQQALHTRTAARKYMESVLVEDCDRFIEVTVRPANVCEVLEYSVEHGNIARLDSAIDRILEENAGDVLKSEAFIAASRESVMRIVKNPRLGAGEYDIIRAVYAWVVALCRQETDKPTIATMQRTIRPFLPELRFLALNPVEFVNGPCSWKIMTESETLAVLSNIIEPGSEKLPEVICKSSENRVYTAYWNTNKFGSRRVCPQCGNWF